MYESRTVIEASTSGWPCKRRTDSAIAPQAEAVEYAVIEQNEVVNGVVIKNDTIDDLEIVLTFETSSFAEGPLSSNFDSERLPS